MTAEGAEKRLASAVVLQAVVDYVKGRRRLDRHPDQETAVLVADAVAFIKSDNFNRVFLPEWADSGEQLLEILERKYKSVSLKTPREPTTHGKYYRIQEKERQREREENCPGHQYKPHNGRIYDGICTVCGAKRKRKREEMPYGW